MAQCVYCDKVENLNTQLTVTLEDGNRITVDICDEHAEEASIKTAKAAHLDKQRKIEEVLAQAKALGLDLSQTDSGLTVAATQPTQPTPASPTPVAQNPVLEDMGGDDVIETGLIDSRPGMTSVGGSTDMGAVASHTSHQVIGQEDILSEEILKGKAKMGLAEGREGMPMAIPEKRVDGTGTTRIKITKAEDDQKLQSRFKKMADDSMHDKVPDFARSGYSNTTVNCGMCRGEGSINNAGKIIECPKCGGAGIISTY
jgi:hypothetical protein